MVDQLLIGDHPTIGMGGFVSRPSIDVKFATKFQMMFSTLFENLQISESGSFIVDGHQTDRNWTTFGFASLGYLPMILLSCDTLEIELEYLSNTSARARRLDPAFTYSGNTDNTDKVVYYIVTKLPV